MFPIYPDLSQDTNIKANEENFAINFFFGEELMTISLITQKASIVAC
jgi:hypothetical protein